MGSTEIASIKRNTLKFFNVAASRRRIQQQERDDCGRLTITKLSSVDSVISLTDSSDSNEEDVDFENDWKVVREEDIPCFQERADH